MSKKITRIGVGGPVGSGKTAIVEAITPRLLNLGMNVLIITNDVVTTEDAKHVQRVLKGILLPERIIGVETGACPHTAVREDPSMNLAAVEDMERRFPDSDVMLIESGGDNLTLTFSPALVDYFLYVIDVAPVIRSTQERARDHAFGHPHHQQDRSGALRGRQPRRDETRFATDAWQQAVPVHKLQDRRGHFGTSRTDRKGVSFRHELACSGASMIPAAPAFWAAAHALGASAPELAAFQDEPPQMRSGTVGKTGFPHVRAPRPSHDPDEH
jgi:hypothetical protein